MKPTRSPDKLAPTVADGIESRSTVTKQAQEPEQHYAPGEVARLFGVDPKTVTRWCSIGKLSSIRTLGGHRRIPKSEVDRVLRGES